MFCNKVKVFSSQGRVITSDSFVYKSNIKKEIGRFTGASIVDMESFELCKLSRGDKIPFACVKVVSDTSDEDINVNFSMFMNRFGEVAFFKTVKYLAKKPSKIYHLFKFFKNSPKARRSIFRLSQFLKQAF